LGQPEVGQSKAGAIHEEPDRFVVHEALGGKTSIGRGRQGEGSHRPGDLARDAQGLPAGGQHPHPRARVQKGVHQPRRCLDEVLAVVQNQEQLFVSQGLHERIGERLAGTLLHLQNPDYLLSHQLRLGEWRKFHQPHPVRVGSEEASRHLER
jgi:hypothetical protein